MSKQRAEKLMARKVPDKTSPQQPLVQIEGKLTEAQLKAIAGGGIETSPKN